MTEIAGNISPGGMFVRSEVLSARYGLVWSNRVRNEYDAQVQKALTLFPQARELAMLADQPTDGAVRNRPR